MDDKPSFGRIAPGGGFLCAGGSTAHTPMRPFTGDPIVMIAYTQTLALLGVPVWAWLLSLVVACLIVWFVIARQRDLQQDPNLHLSTASDGSVRAAPVRGTADAFAATNVAMHGGVENGNLDIPVHAAALATGSQSIHQQGDVSAAVLHPATTDALAPEDESERGTGRA